MSPLTQAAYLAVPLAALAAAITHSLAVRGRRVTRIFFGFALSFFGFKGAMDLGRQLSDFSFVMHLHLLQHGDKNFGFFALFLPAIRATFAYAGVCFAEQLWKRWPNRRGRFWPMVSGSLFGYCALGVALEYLNARTGWWVWRPEMDNIGFVHYLFTWVIWGGGYYETFFLNFARWKRFQRPARFAVAYFVGYFALMIGVSVTAPFLRNPIFISLGMLFMVLGLKVRGPELEALRQPAA
ncbi:MAG: hypothetical protein U0610_07070 [bacterium]